MSQDELEDYYKSGCYNSNIKLRRAGFKVPMNVFEREEFAKSFSDVKYFIKTYVKTISLDGGLVDFCLHPYQEKMIDTMHGNRFTIFMTSRQMGKTVTTAAYLLHQLIFNKSFTIAILANKGDQAQEIMERMQTMYEELPWWMQPGVVYWNKRSIKLGNKSRAFTGATTASSVRGKSINIVYMDEFAHIENDVAFYQSTYPVISSGKSSKVIITSTPNGMNLFYKLWTEAERGESAYKALQIFWHEHPHRDAAWLEEQLQNMPTKQVAQEIHCEFQGSSDTLISGQKLQQLVHKKPAFATKNDEMMIYEMPIKGHSYVATVDTAEGVGLDSSVCSIFDVTARPFKHVAKYRTNSVIPLLFAKHVNDIALRYNEALLIVEANNSSGGIICNELWNSHEYENMLTTKQVDNMTKITGQAKSIPGIRTTVKTKATGCTALKSLIETDTLITNDMDTISEFSTFCLDSTGKTYKATKGKHDDCVMSLVIFAWFTNEPYFTEMTDSDIKASMRERLEEMESERMGSAGFFDDGTGEDLDGDAVALIS